MNTIEYTRMHDAEDRQWWYVGMRAITAGWLKGQIQASPRPRLLDAGCGTGRNLELLEDHGSAVGIDLSEDALRFCRTRAVRVARAQLLRLPFADQSFECVTSFDVIYHRWVQDDRQAVAEMARVLRPGGVLFVRVPALHCLFGAHDEAVHSRHRYTRRELAALLSSAGLEVVRASYCNTLLLPLIFTRRTLDRLTGRHGSDVGFLPAPLEWLFRQLLMLEAWWLRRSAFPLGASVMALGRKPLSSTNG
jgi:SAM-dependent methyltransferase